MWFEYDSRMVHDQWRHHGSSYRGSVLQAVFEMFTNHGLFDCHRNDKSTTIKPSCPVNELAITRRSLTIYHLPIRSVHPSKSITIVAFWREKGESQLDGKGNTFNTFNVLDNIYCPFRPLSLSWIPIKSVALVAILALHASNCNFIRSRIAVWTALLSPNFSIGRYTLEARQHQTEAVRVCLYLVSMDCASLPCIKHQQKQALLVASLWCTDDWWIGSCNTWNNCHWSVRGPHH